MKKLIVLICAFFSIWCIYSQKYIRPVFDRTDNYLFHIDSVEVTKDSTFLFFTYDAEGGSWANISDNTHIVDKESGKEYKAISVQGIPFQPAKRHFTYSGKMLVKVSFASIDKMSRFDFVENKQDSTAFNIYGIDLKEFNDRIAGGTNMDHLNSLSSRVDFYVQLGDFNKAIELEQESMMIIKALLGKSSIGYAVSMMKMALFSWKLGHFQDAINYGEEELRLCHSYYGDNHETYANSLTSLAGYYCSIGNYQKALSLDEQALSIRQKRLGDDSFEYAESLVRLANDYSGLGDYKQAITLLKEGIRIQESQKENNVASYLVSLNNLATIYSKTNDLESAKSIENKVVQSVEEFYGKNSPEYASSIGNLAQYELHLGNSLTAQNLAEEDLAIQEKYFGKRHPEYKSALNNLSYILFCNGYLDQAIDRLLECITLYEERDIKDDLIRYIDILNNLSYYYACKNDFGSAVSYSKKAVKLAKEYLMITGKLEGNQKYLFWQKYNTMFDDAIPFYMIHCSNDSSSLELFDLSLYSKGFSLKTDSIQYSYTDIQKRLKDEDVAVEFISPTMTFNNKTSLIVYALALDNSHAPKVIRLFSSDELNERMEKNENKDSIIGNMLWQPILKEFGKVKNIFFSPTFVLNSMGVEYMPVGEMSHLSDNLNIYRLSSLGKLIEPSEKGQYKSATLYGNLDYNVVEDSQLGNLSLRGGYESLPFSGEEIKEIGSLLKANGVKLMTYIGNKGTEETFKRLSGQTNEIIHLATHGRYLNSEKAKEEQISHNLGFIKHSSEEGPMYEDDILTRSFLLFSGGNRMVYRESIPLGTDDGFLTAAEIAKMDLHKTDLVVLSACESALGDWSVDEGVLGLSRGFKRAGVNTILMSLNQVDDEATKILMVEFYKNLMSGKSKLQSLKDAQRYLRQVDNGKYDDPKYWATFILLDGID